MNNRGSTSDPAVIAADTAGVVPPELSLAWLGESRDRPALAIIVATGLLTSLVVASRLASSTLFLRRLTLDDRLAAVSLVRPMPSHPEHIQYRDSNLPDPPPPPHSHHHPPPHPRRIPPPRIPPIRHAAIDSVSSTKTQPRRSVPPDGMSPCCAHLRPRLLPPSHQHHHQFQFQHQYPQAIFSQSQPRQHPLAISPHISNQGRLSRRIRQRLDQRIGACFVFGLGWDGIGDRRGTTHGGDFARVQRFGVCGAGGDGLVGAER